MPSTDHGPIPKPIPSPKDDPPSPRRTAPESLHPLQPTSLHVAIEPVKVKEILELESKYPLEPKKSVAPVPSTPSLEEEPEEVEDSKLDVVDMEIFNQILELDEEEDSHDFSKPMVWEYFDQAEQTFKDMDHAFTNKDLPSLSSLGHFLKGSSAALGLSRVQDTCEKIQHVGVLRDETTNKDLSSVEALVEMKKLLRRVKDEYKEAKAWLKDFYANDDA